MNLLPSIFIIASLLFTCLSARGTTPNIKEIFIGRCADFQATGTLQNRIDCNRVWNTFNSVFADKDPCQVNTSGYDEFIKQVSTPVPRDVSTFWSGTYSFVHLYIRAVGKLKTLENLFPGYLVNGLHWCGQKAQPGLNYNTCHDAQGCDSKNSYDFWSKMSTWFARSSSGTVRVLLNSSRVPAFSPHSFFAKFEFPNLMREKVDKIEIIVVHDLDMKVNKSERCGAGSIKTLTDLIQQRNFAWTCSDNPSSAYYTLCAANPNHFQCQNIHGVLRVVILAGLGAAGLGIIILLGVIFSINRRRFNTAEKQRDKYKTEF